MKYLEKVVFSKASFAIAVGLEGSRMKIILYKVAGLEMVFLMYFWFVLHKGRKILIMFIALLWSKSVYLRHCNKNGYIL